MQSAVAWRPRPRHSGTMTIRIDRTLDPVSLASQLRDNGLSILGGFHPDDTDGTPPGTATLLLLGPREPGFWAHVSAQPEFRDGASDPLDRWSRRVIGRLACDLGAKALFPFGGPPYHPFVSWALRSGRAWSSPVRLLVHDTAGLMVSFRGALALRDRVPLSPAPHAAPCETCRNRPCLTACPVGALGGGEYETDACHGFLDQPTGTDCLTAGCKVRRSCPVSMGYGRQPEQSAHHMRYFHR